MEHAFLAAVIMGIVFVQNITMLEIWQDILKAIGTVTQTSSYSINFTFAFVILMGLPIGMLWLTAKLATTQISGNKIRENFVRLGYAIIPLDLAGHLAHNLFHALTEGKAIWFNTVSLFGYEISGNVSLASTGVVQFLQYAVVVLGLVGSVYAVYRIGNKGKWTTLLPYYALMILFTVMNIYLFSLPMSHRV